MVSFVKITQSSPITHGTQRGALAPLLSEPSLPRSAHHLGTGVTCLAAERLCELTPPQIKTHPAAGAERMGADKRRGVRAQRAKTRGAR